MDVARYRRHLVLEHVGPDGQGRLSAATLVADDELEALYLAAAGIGALTVPSRAIADRVHALRPDLRPTVGSQLVERSARAASEAALAKLRAVLRGVAA